jgi:GNAT superfamily N-acetyltransferase
VSTEERDAIGDVSAPSSDHRPSRAIVRARRQADLDACEQLVRVVYELDGYPGHWPDDLRGFLADPVAIAAWVAVAADEIVGHVALHPDSSEAAMSLATSATGLPPSSCGFVCRLFVAPTARRSGIGRALLETAAQHARGRGLRPILDVVTRFQAAIDLYETSGWTRAGTVVAHVGDDITLEEFVYVAPPAAR